MIEQPHHPQHRILPSTPAGRWSVTAAVVSLVALAVFFGVVAAGQKGGDSFTDNWLLSGPILLVLVSGVVGLIAAIVAVLRSGERGILLALPVLWGLLVSIQALGEVISPH